MPRVIAIIPARLASSRFPGKPLVAISGVPLVEHVRRRALLSPAVDDAIVATCDTEIMETVIGAGGHAVLTSDRHERCTTRVEEAMHHFEADVVIIVQGDEPLIRPDMLDLAARPLLEHAGIDCVNVLSPIVGDGDLADTSIVKAAVDQKGFILFYSRAPIPVYQKPGLCPIYRQTGIIAFRLAFLREYTTMPETPFERVESIDMLRVLEHGRRVAGVVTQHVSIGVDYPRDVKRVEKILAGDPDQRAIHDRIQQKVSEVRRC